MILAMGLGCTVKLITVESKSLHDDMMPEKKTTPKLIALLNLRSMLGKELDYVVSASMFGSTPRGLHDDRCALFYVPKKRESQSVCEIFSDATL